jgi:hypothetical protein
MQVRPATLGIQVAVEPEAGAEELNEATLGPS